MAEETPDKDLEELDKVPGLSKGSSKAKISYDQGAEIVINDQGLDKEQREVKTEIKPKITRPRVKVDNSKEAKAERLKKLIQKLRDIAIRVPLIVYGANIADGSKIELSTFHKLIDDASWKEFMPNGVTKKLFVKFSKYFDADVFSSASEKIRLSAKNADELPCAERICAIAKIFSSFRNPTKETVLTPWRVINLHYSMVFGGYSFFKDDECLEEIDLESDSPIKREVQDYAIQDVYNKDAKILDINSKTGLYSLFAAYTLCEEQKNDYDGPFEELWKKVLSENVFSVCRTKMAASVTMRTLRGFKDYDLNVFTYENIISDMKSKIVKAKNIIEDPKNWNRGKMRPFKEKMKFTTIIGNPPYQEVVKDNNLQSPVYYLFIDLVREM
jgi:hypothetical protein